MPLPRPAACRATIASGQFRTGLQVHQLCSGFHSTPARRSDDQFPNHYATLELKPSATAAEIKKQFYALSKKHHPDHHPASARSEASTKFVAISDAYHVLGSSDKRTRYDRDYNRVYASQAQRPETRAGSHFGGPSSQGPGPAGSRPASGLSKRRSQFRGPPPSYYAWGGRDKPPSQGAYEGTNSSGASGTGAAYGGENPRTQFYEPDPDIPYWDREAHFRTHDRIRQRREGGKGQREDDIPLPDVGGTGLNFLLVTGMVLVSMGIPAYFLQKSLHG